MSGFENLTDDNILIYAMKSYESPNCIMSEFEEDYKKIKYVKKLISKYKSSKILRDRLILNHIICLSNVFGIEAATRILFFRIDISDYDILKTFLSYLSYLPDVVVGIKNSDICTNDIPINKEIEEILRRI